jgi:zinc/manganese transport system permease protein
LVTRYQDLVFIGVDPDGAQAAKRPVTQIRFIAIVITALVVISAITAVGIILVIALLCAPVLMHIDKSTSLKQLILKSSATGLALTSGGMMLAIAVDLPPGPVIGSLCMIMLILKRI